MATTVPPIPQKSPLADKNGMITEAWNRWFIILFGQVGNGQPSNGQIGLSLANLQDQINENLDELRQGRSL